MYIRQAEAYSHLDKPTQALQSCDEALKLGAPLSSLYHIKMRAYLENTELQVKKHLIRKQRKFSNNFLTRTQNLKG